MFKKTILLLVLFTAGSFSGLYAAPEMRGNFIIFPSYTGNSLYDAVLRAGESALIETCNAAGRLVPVEYNYKKAGLEKSEGSDRDDLYRNTAVFLKADIYAVLTSYDEKGDYVLKLDLIPLNDRYAELKSGIIVRSRIPDNLPMKAARAFAGLIKNLTIRAEVLKVFDNGSAVINAGQWHGLETGEYPAVSGSIIIKNVSRYSAVITGGKYTPGDYLEIRKYPDMEKYIRKINFSIRENTVKRYGSDEILDKRAGSVRESIKGTCVISQGANFCLPGYGSYLSVEYMGIDKSQPDYTGIFFGSSLTAVHLGMVPVLTGFNVNFFPWIADSDRTANMHRLNYFLWGSIPVTFAVSFYNQLAYNYREKNMLPPMFAGHDTAAAIVAVFVPGGGMFYKGYRWPGWGIYFTEMSLAGYAVYSGKGNKRNAVLGTLAAVKIAEIITSYLISPSYPYYNREVASSGEVDISLGVISNICGDEEITASALLRF